MPRLTLVVSAILLLGACNDPVHSPTDDSGPAQDLLKTQDARSADSLGAEGGLNDLAQDSAQGDSNLGDSNLGDSNLGDRGAEDLNSADLVAVDGGLCSAEVAALAAKLDMNTKACTVVIRLNYQDLTPLGYQVFCGAYTAVSEQNARTTAQAATGYGAAGQMLNAASPTETYVFFEAAGDFGGSAAVSAQTGLALFGGSTFWMGTGEITYPQSWEPASQLGTGCPTVGTLPVTLGYDLRTGQSMVLADINAAVDRARQTAAPAAIWQQGYLFSAVALLYPRSVGAFDPTTAEWIVLLNGGWLE